MPPEFLFHISVTENGYQSVHSSSSTPNTNLINMIIRQCGHSIKEMNWFKEEINKELAKGERTRWGHNILCMYIDEASCELYLEGSYEQKQIIPTDLIHRYIDECLRFLKKYHSNGIPGLETRL